MPIDKKRTVQQKAWLSILLPFLSSIKDWLKPLLSALGMREENKRILAFLFPHGGRRAANPQFQWASLPLMPAFPGAPPLWGTLTVLWRLCFGLQLAPRKPFSWCCHHTELLFSTAQCTVNRSLLKIQNSSLVFKALKLKEDCLCSQIN
jgi:hypothetical protein